MPWAFSDAAQKHKNYYKYIAEHKDIMKITIMLNTAISSTRSEISRCFDIFAKYTFLWKDDREEKIKVGLLDCFVYLPTASCPHYLKFASSWNSLT